MKHYIVLFTLLALLFPPSVRAQQPKVEALLDKTAETFRHAGGVQIKFTLKTYTGKRLEGESDGTIRLKGEKFMLETPGTFTWFDGTTQWSYVEDNEEVNVSTPTEEELRSLNPYTLLYMYKKGFSCQAGKTTNYNDHPVKEVILTSTDPSQELSKVTLYIATNNYQPLFIRLTQKGSQSYSEIAVTDYRTQQRYADKEFTFDPALYPDAEVIDLR